MRLTALLPVVIAAGCMPELTSPPGGELDLADWLPPENSWDAADALPGDLSPEGFLEGQTVPDVRLMDQHGDEVSLWQFYGNVIAIDLSTMWCGLQGLAKHVDETWEDYRDQGFMYLTMLPENRLQRPQQDDLALWGETHDHPRPSGQRGYAYQIEPNQAWPGWSSSGGTSGAGQPGGARRRPRHPRCHRERPLSCVIGPSVSVRGPGRRRRGAGCSPRPTAS